MEKLLANQLDGMIEVPEVLNFTCDDRSELLNQLKILQMVLRKERDKNKDNSISVTNVELSRTQSSLSNKEDLQEKVNRHKKAMVQKRQDKLKQMDTEAQALSKALNDEGSDNSDNSKVSKKILEFKIMEIGCNEYNIFIDKKEKSEFNYNWFRNKENERDQYRE